MIHRRSRAAALAAGAALVVALAASTASAQTPVPTERAPLPDWGGPGFDGPYPARTITVETVRFPSPNIAIADGRYEIAASQGAAARRMWTSFLMVQSGGTWRIAAIRNMLPAPPAPVR